MRKVVAVIGAGLGIVALVLQFSITIPASMEAGRDLAASIVYYFSFFTILTNLTLVLIYLGAVIKGKRWLGLFRRPATRSTAAAAIILVGVFYHLLLADLWEPQGLFLICDVILHYVTPIMYLIWFSLWNRTGTLSWSVLPKMLLAPVIYVAYVLARGAITHEYPYEIFNATRAGYGPIAVNIANLIAVFILLSLIAIAIDRSLLWRKAN